MRNNGNAVLVTAVEPVLEGVYDRMDFAIFGPKRLRGIISEKEEELEDAETRIESLERTNAFLRAQQEKSEILLKAYQTRDKQTEGMVVAFFGALDIITDALAVASEPIWRAIWRGKRLPRIRKILAGAYEIER